MEFLWDMVAKSGHEMSFGRILESLIVYSVVWNRLKPQLKTLTDEISQLKTAVTSGFNSGEQRFAKIETRLHDLELTRETKLAMGGNS